MKFVYDRLDLAHYVWRGQRCDPWPLESTLDRALDRAGVTASVERERSAAQHLDAFRMAARGRRGPNPATPPNENEWWALGQHNGLVTPLLDWTTSPFVAAYFAFQNEGPKQTKRRAVWALSRTSVDKASAAIEERETVVSKRPPIVEFVRPASDDNPRLLSQGGLFTRAPDNLDIETWVRQQFKGDRKWRRLMKITIPDSERVDCLRMLNRMNINHASLFPDLFGASLFCNARLEMPKY